MAFQGYTWATGAVLFEKPAVVPAQDILAGQVPDRAEPRKVTLVELMAIQAAINAFLIVALPLILRGTSGARLRDLGLTLEGWRQQVVVGVVAILLLMPLVYAAQGVAMRVLGPFDEQFQHPLQQMLQKQFSVEVAVLALVSAAVLAPFFEEMMFRGIFQSWLINLLDRASGRSHRPGFERSDSVQPISSQLESPPLESVSEIEDGRAPAFWTEDLAHEETDRHPSTEEWPRRHVEESVPIQTLPEPYPPSPVCVAFAIVITSLIFAGLHAGQWPAPIPIFVLSLGLGFIYHRTGSVLAAICMHALFNGTSTLVLFFALVAGVPVTAEKKVPPPAIERVAPVEKVKSVVSGEDSRTDRGKR